MKLKPYMHIKHSLELIVKQTAILKMKSLCVLLIKPLLMQAIQLAYGNTVQRFVTN